MPEAADQLERECQLFCRYLADLDATPDIVTAYQRAHSVERLNIAASTPGDRALLRLAHIGKTSTQIADAFAGALAPASVLRKKLVVLMSILESRGESATAINHATPGPRVTWLLTSGLAGVGWLIRLAVASVALAGLRIWYAILPPR